MSPRQLQQEPKNRSKTYNILNNIFSAITHGIGFCLAVTGLVTLIVKTAHTGSAVRVTAFTLYGSSLIILYLFPTPYHSLTSTRAKWVFQTFDHSSIFILTIGAYMPYTLVVIGGAKGWAMFSIILALAIFGILFYIFNQGEHVVLDTILYVLMGWVVTIASGTLYLVLGPIGFRLLVWGGITYTVGAILLSMCGVPYIHVIWHTFVLLGPILTYFLILLYA